jgi:hypothetical protein
MNTLLHELESDTLDITPRADAAAPLARLIPTWLEAVGAMPGSRRPTMDGGSR